MPNPFIVIFGNMTNKCGKKLNLIFGEKIKLPFLFHKNAVFGPKLPFFVGPKLPFILDRVTVFRRKLPFSVQKPKNKKNTSI